VVVHCHLDRQLWLVRLDVFGWPKEIQRTDRWGRLAVSANPSTQNGFTPNLSGCLDAAEVAL
jgi:hypothetical protein